MCREIILVSGILISFTNGHPTNLEYNINEKCFAVMIIYGAIFGAVVGGSCGAILVTWVFKNERPSSSVIGVIIGSTFFGGGAGVLSTLICFNE